jgi:DNA-binding MarR family transcriptional regulator
MNTIKDGGTTVDSVAERINMFADSTRVQSVVDRFKQQGWVEGDDELKVTESGEQKFQQVAAVQNGVRDALMQTISQDEYVQIITVLQRMIRGL